MTTLPTMSDALAAGDGLLHARIDELEAHNMALLADVKDCQQQSRDYQASNAVIKSQMTGLEARLLKWETALTAVMPADFKDWHQNSKAEWPELAASTLVNLRERLEEANAWAERLETQVAALTADAERYRWLREKHNSTDIHSLWHVRDDEGKPVKQGMLDTDIDAAMPQKGTP